MQRGIPDPRSAPQGPSGATGTATEGAAGCRLPSAAPPLQDRRSVAVGRGGMRPPYPQPLPSSSNAASDSELSSDALSSAGTAAHSGVPRGTALPRPPPNASPLPSPVRLSRHAQGRRRDRLVRLTGALRAAPSPAALPRLCRGSGVQPTLGCERRGESIGARTVGRCSAGVHPRGDGRRGRRAGAQPWGWCIHH